MGAHDLIDLGVGQPEKAILPRELLRGAAASALAVADNGCLQYGPEDGSPSLREALAGFLTRQYGRVVQADELLVTNGASHGLDLVLGCFTAPGDTVVVEAPTYFLGLDVLRDRKVRLVPVPVDAAGLDTDALAALVHRESPRLVYTIPVFHNPTGMTMPPTRRRHLTALAAEHDFLVAADEVYQLVTDPSRVPGPVRCHDRERVLSLGSFSKILGPGVRLGWVEGPPRLLARLRDNGVLRSGGGASPMTSAIVAEAIRSGRQEQFLTELRAVYDRRRRHAVALLSATLPPQVRVTYPDGGYYVWLELPGVDAAALRAEAVAAGVDFRPGPVFSVDGSFTSCLRICFTYHDEERLTTGIERLTRVIGSRAN